MKRLGFITLGLIGLLLLAVLLGWAKLRYSTIDLTMTRKELQKEIEKSYPIHSPFLTSTISFVDPEVILNPTTERIGMRIRIEVSHPEVWIGEWEIHEGGLLGSGSISVDGSLRYVPREGILYYDDSLVQELVVDGLPAEYDEVLKEVINFMLTNGMDQVPIVHLSNERNDEALARMVLRDIVIREDRLRVILSLREPGE